MSMLNPNVLAVEEPPIAEAQGWVSACEFAPERPLIDLAQALPGYPAEVGLRAHLKELLDSPALGSYTDIAGLPELRTAFARDLNRAYQSEVQAEEVFIAAGCNQAFFLAMLTLAAPGTEVILPSPYYFNHKMTLEMLGIRPVLLPCHLENGMLPDPQEVVSLITPNTRALVLVTPNNPTGVVYPPELLDELFELAQTHGLPLVVDETYRDFLPGENPVAHSLFNRNWQGTLVQLYSFSKAFALAGYRIGAITASADLLEQIAKVMDCAAICASHLSQRAVLYGLQHLDDWREQNRVALNTRAQAFQDALESAQSGYRLATLGPYFAYLQHPHSGQTSTEVAKHLVENAALLTLPGSMFGPEQEDYLRIAFSNVGQEVLLEVASRLARFG
ncbi:MAG: aminotransferase [SAR324 cluster bacterium]|nr:aminotransferase [SAR324 cluster bacterium]